jgi:GMP synthase (glutamine-hydrolysing)
VNQPAPAEVIVVQHQDDAGPGNLRPWLDGLGLTWTLVGPETAPYPGLDAVRAVVVLGSREAAYDDSVWWLAGEMRFLESALDRGTPVLGICFGAQLLARVTGGTVRPSPNPERGWIDVGSDNPLLHRRWFAWHSDEITPPSAAVVEAVSPACVQAYSLGKNLAVQFHPEVTEAEVTSWLESTRQLDQLRGSCSAEDILRQTRAEEHEATRAAHRLYDLFFDGI